MKTRVFFPMAILAAALCLAAGRIAPTSRLHYDPAGQDAVKIAVILVVGLLLALLIWKLTIGRRRYRYGKNVRPSRNYKGRKRGF